MKRLIFITLTLLLTTTSCRILQNPSPSPAPSAESTPQAADPVFNIRYSDETVQRADALALDVYPLTGQNHPVMIFVHGGGWFRGDKSSVEAKPAAFNARGFVFVSVNYRLIAEVDLARQAGDVANAIAWVKRNIGRYGGDASRLFLMGHSAGAHLVALIGTDETYLRAAGLAFADIKGIVTLDTQAYDMFILMKNLAPGQGEVYRNAFGDDPAFWKEMSPKWHVEAAKGIPPFFIVYTSEKESRAYFSKRFHAALQEAGVPSVLLPALDYAHEEVNNNFGLPGDRVSAAVFEWLEGLLQARP